MISTPDDAYTGSNVNLNTLNKTSSQLPPTIKNIFSDQNKHYLILAGLGGFTGSYLSKTIPDFLKATKHVYSIIVSLPFSHEGLVKRKQAMAIKHSLDHQYNTVFVDYDSIREKHGNFGLKEAFNIADEYTAQAFRQFKY